MTIQPPHRRTRQPAIALAALLLSACAARAPYQPPALDIGTHFKQGQTTLDAAPINAAGVQWSPAQAADSQPRGTWWAVFQDPVLNELQARLATGNFDIQLAQAQLRQAQATVRAARAAFYPKVDATLGATRASTSTPARQPLLVNPVGNSFAADVTASWEADLWGRLHAQARSSQALAQASEADLGNARLAAQSALAQTYVSLRMAERQAALQRELVQGDEETLRLTMQRHRAGVVSGGDVEQAQTQLKSAQAALLEVEVTRAQLEHAIAVLLGLAPSRFTLPPAAVDLQVPPLPAAGLPSQLLQRRPDIAAAERRVASRDQQLRAADVAWFPTLSLSGSLGARSSDWADLWSAPTRVWSLGPQLAATLLDGGARSDQLAQGEAALDAAVASYRLAVLGAIEEVENQLAALRVLEREAQVQDDAVAAARRALEITLAQYRAGTVGAQNVVAAQAAVSSAERGRVDLHGRRLAASVSLIQALGGGWQADRPATQKGISGSAVGVATTPRPAAPVDAGAPSLPASVR